MSTLNGERLGTIGGSGKCGRMVSSKVNHVQLALIVQAYSTHTMMKLKSFFRFTALFFQVAINIKLGHI